MGKIDRDLVQSLDWNLLKIFDAIVQSGGIARAAQRLGRQQPAISLALKRLEDRTQCRLCRRGPAGFMLSEEGRRLAEICQQLREQVRNLPDTIAGTGQEVKGSLRVSVISNLISPTLDRLILRFNERYPLVKILVDVASWNDVIDALLRGDIDVGISPARQQRAELNYLRLFREVHVAYCGRGHRLFGARKVRPAQLAEEHFVLTGSDEPDQLSDFRLRYGIGRHVAGVSPHLEEAKRLTTLGVGLCFLPEGYAAPEVASGRLWPVLSPTGAPRMDIFVITNPNAPHHLSRQLFVEETLALLAEPEATPRARQARRHSR
jgi:DNA-binding transcriptional LysR family regulator